MMVKVIMGNVGRNHTADEMKADRIVRYNILIMKLCEILVCLEIHGLMNCTSMLLIMM